MPEISPKGAPTTKVWATVRDADELELLLATQYRSVGLVPSESIPQNLLCEFLSHLLAEVPDAWIRLPDFEDSPASADPNPALGLRGVRRYHAHPDELTTFLDSLASLPKSESPLHLLIPMLTNRTQVEPIVAQVRTRLEQRDIRIGAMIETPAAALSAEEFTKLCDFVCLDSTQLAQYVYAADSQTPALGAYAHPAAPPLMELYARTIQAAKQQNVPIGICGIAATDSVVGPFLLATGAHHLSVPVDQMQSLNDHLSSC